MNRNHFFRAMMVFLCIFVLTGCTALAPSSGKKERPVTHGFYRSTDGGKQWCYLTDPTGVTAFPPINISAFDSDPFVPGIVYALTDYGLWRTNDKGTTWSQVNKGMRAKGEVAQLQTLVFDVSNTNHMIVAGYFQGIGKIFATRNGGEDWTQVYKDDAQVSIVGIALDSNRPDLIYAVGSDLGFKESLDGGKSWKRIRWLPDDIPELRSVGALQFWANPFNVNEMYILTSSGVFKSTDRGTSWELKRSGLVSRLNPNDPTEVPVQISRLYFDTTHNTIYAATNLGIYESNDRGENWWNTTLQLPIRTPSVNALAYSLQNPGVLYFSTGNVTVYRTFNLGQSWDSTGVAKQDCNNPAAGKVLLSPNTSSALMIDPVNPDIIYLGVQFVQGT
ncbi:MAG: YCF48-related protein [bacterium]